MSVISALHKNTLRGNALLWQYVYRVQIWLGNWKRKFGGLAVLVIFIILTSISLYFSNFAQGFLENYYSSEKAVEGLRALILSIGSALIGAAAIVTSLVLFAMQVNIERMPYGLFRRLSADWKLLSPDFSPGYKQKRLKWVAPRINWTHIWLQRE